VTDSGPDPEKDQQDEVLPNAAADEFFGRMKHDFRRPKPSEEAIASALQAIQKLTGEVSLDHSVNSSTQSPEGKCPKCGGENSAMNRFCGYCGAPMERGERPRSAAQVPGSSEGQHIYHHHYHHHIFSEAEKAPEKKLEVGWKSQPASDKTEEVVSSETQADAADAIQKLVQKWSRWFNSKRMDDLMELYSADSIVLRPNANPAHGKEAVRLLLEVALEAGLGDVQLDCADIGIVGDFACLTGGSKMLVPTAPAKRYEETGKYLIVVRRESGQWRIVADSWCMDVPKAQPTSASAPVLPIRAQRK
jgi:ketosteroid isomerase-like protein